MLVKLASLPSRGGQAAGFHAVRFLLFVRSDSTPVARGGSRAACPRSRWQRSCLWRSCASRPELRGAQRAPRALSSFRSLSRAVQGEAPLRFSRLTTNRSAPRLVFALCLQLARLGSCGSTQTLRREAPLADVSLKRRKPPRWELNPRPCACKASALPIEPRGLLEL
jgi:hypothetical protein